MFYYFLGALKRKSSDIIYLLLDQFTTAESAPLVSPRTMEPGGTEISQWDITDTNNNFSIVSGALQASDRVITTQDPLAIANNGLPWTTGLVLVFDLNIGTSAVPLLGFSNSNSPIGPANLENGLRTTGAYTVTFADGIAPQLDLVSDGDDYKIGISLNSLGSYFFAKKNTNDWQLLFLRVTTSVSTVYPAIASHVNGIHDVDAVSVVQLSSPFDTDYGIATHSLRPTVADLTGSSGQFTGTANHVTTARVVLPGSPTNGDTPVKVFFNMDSGQTKTGNDHDYAQFIYNTSQWDIQIREVSGGTDTLINTYSNVGTNIDLIKFERNGNSLFTKTYVNGISGTETTQGTETLSANSARTDIEVEYTGVTAPSNALLSYDYSEYVTDGLGSPSSALTVTSNLLAPKVFDIADISSNSQQIEYRFRYTDANNYNAIRATHDGTNFDMTVIKVVSGTTSTLATLSNQTITGNLLMLQPVATGNNINAYYCDNLSKNTDDEDKVTFSGDWTTIDTGLTDSDNASGTGYYAVVDDDALEIGTTSIPTTSTTYNNTFDPIGA